jgi:hypothetical protein
VLSGNLPYPSTFGDVPTCVSIFLLSMFASCCVHEIKGLGLPSTHFHVTDQISPSFPSSRGSSTSPWYTVGGKIWDKNLEQRKNIKFCVMIGKSASKTLAPLTWAYGEYAMKKSSAFHWHRRFKEGREMCKMIQEVGSLANMDRI